MLNNSLFFLLIIQSVIHLQGVMVGTNALQTDKWNTDSDFIDRFFSGKNKKLICFALYAISMLLFFSAAFSYDVIFVPGTIWLNVMVSAVSISFIALEVFPNAVGVLINRRYAIALNIMIALLYFYMLGGWQFIT